MGLSIKKTRSISKNKTASSPGIKKGDHTLMSPNNNMNTTYDDQQVDEEPLRLSNEKDEIVQKFQNVPSKSNLIEPPEQQ